MREDGAVGKLVCCTWSALRCDGFICILKLKWSSLIIPGINLFANCKVLSNFLGGMLHRSFPPFLLLNFLLSSKGCFTIIVNVRPHTPEDILLLYC